MPHKQWTTLAEGFGAGASFIELWKLQRGNHMIGLVVRDFLIRLLGQSGNKERVFDLIV